MSTAAALTWMGVIGAVGVGLDAAAGLSTRAALSDTGIFAFAPLQTGWKRCLHGSTRRPLAWLFAYPRVLSLYGAQLVAVAAVFSVPFLPQPWQRIVGATAAGLVLLARMLVHARNQIGHDGSDQMTLVVFSSVFVGWLALGTGVAMVAVWYAALQLLLSYVAAGVAKAVSPTWRNGTAMPAILNTVGLGRPELARFLLPHRSVSSALGWSVIAFECLAPALLLLGPHGAYALIALGCAFHAGIAYTMGLNTFFWAFTAAYPALLVLA